MVYDLDGLVNTTPQYGHDEVREEYNLGMCAVRYRFFMVSILPLLFGCILDILAAHTVLFR
jgi:hypothetical protein